MAENVYQKLVPDPFLILVNSKKWQMHASNSFENNIFWKRIIKKLKKVNLIFLSNLDPFYGQDYKK